MLIAIFRAHDSSSPAADRGSADKANDVSARTRPAGADGSPAAGSVPAASGAAVSWVADRFVIHGRGEVSIDELLTIDAAGNLDWVDARARAWLRSQASGHELPPGPAPRALGSSPAGPPPTTPAPDPDIWGSDKPAPWERFTPEHYRIATYAVLGVIVVLLIVLVAQGGPCRS